MIELIVKGTAIEVHGSSGVSLYTAPVTETYSVPTSSWAALSNKSPFTHAAVITSTKAISAETICTLFNSDPALFAQYGFSIGAISGQNVTIYSIGTPTSAVSFTIGYSTTNYAT